MTDAAFPNENFDVIYSRHVLEHLMDPMSTLIEANRILKKGGILFIEVPNQFNAFKDRIKRAIIMISGRRFEGKLFQKPLSPIHHNYFFNPNACRLWSKGLALQ